MNRKFLFSILLVFVSIALFAQNKKATEWIPTGEWPFVNQKFKVGTIFAGVIRPSKTQVPCNIHIGSQAVLYAKSDTLMQALPGTVFRIEFPDETYIAINGLSFGKIVHEDSIGKVVRVRELDKVEMENRKKDASNLGAFNLMANGDFTGMNIDLSGQYNPHPEENPLPIKDSYYYIFNGEVFPATEKNILSRIDQSRRKEYRAYTRSAEVISSSEKSMVKQWIDFFLNYSKNNSITLVSN